MAAALKEDSNSRYQLWQLWSNSSRCSGGALTTILVDELITGRFTGLLWDYRHPLKECLSTIKYKWMKEGLRQTTIRPYWEKEADDVDLDELLTAPKKCIGECSVRLHPVPCHSCARLNGRRRSNGEFCRSLSWVYFSSWWCIASKSWVRVSIDGQRHSIKWVFAVLAPTDMNEAGSSTSAPLLYQSCVLVARNWGPWFFSVSFLVWQMNGPVCVCLWFLNMDWTIAFWHCYSWSSRESPEYFDKLQAWLKKLSLKMS